MSIHTYTRMHAYILAHICTYTYMRMHTHIDTHMHARMHTHTDTHTHTHTHTHTLSLSLSLPPSLPLFLSLSLSLSLSLFLSFFLSFILSFPLSYTFIKAVACLSQTTTNTFTMLPRARQQQLYSHVVRRPHLQPPVHRPHQQPAQVSPLLHPSLQRQRPPLPHTRRHQRRKLIGDSRLLCRGQRGCIRLLPSEHESEHGGEAILISLRRFRERRW